MHVAVARGLSALLAAALLISDASAYTIGRCASEAEAAFDALNIDRAKISRARTDIQYSGSETVYVSGVNLWLETPGCSGSVVVTFSGTCQFTGTFERGSCTVADLRR